MFFLIIFLLTKIQKNHSSSLLALSVKSTGNEVFIFIPLCSACSNATFGATIFVKYNGIKFYHRKRFVTYSNHCLILFRGYIFRKNKKIKTYV